MAPLALVFAACSPDFGGAFRHAPASSFASDTTPTSGPGSPTTPPPMTGSTTTGGSTTTTGGSTTTTPTTTTTTGDPPWGVDVSHWNGDVDWALPAAAGVEFVYAKVSEGTYFVDDSFPDHDAGALDAGIFRGGYHFGIPDDSDGATQARYFVDHGGGWADDGSSLPGVLDIEWNPNSGNDCYDLSQGELTDWVADFTDEYLALTGRDAVIYTSRTWWNLCVGAPDFGGVNPLWVADWSNPSPNLPTGWTGWTFWQTDAYGTVPGLSGEVDVDSFVGSPGQLAAFADGRWSGF